MMFDPHDPLHPHSQPDKISPTLSQRIEVTSATLPPPNVVRLSVFQPRILWLGISCVPLLSGCLRRAGPSWLTSRHLRLSLRCHVRSYL